MRSFIRAIVLPVVIAGALILGPMLPQVASAQVEEETICVDLQTGYEVPCTVEYLAEPSVVEYTVPAYYVPRFFQVHHFYPFRR